MNKWEYLNTQPLLKKTIECSSSKNRSHYIYPSYGSK